MHTKSILAALLTLWLSGTSTFAQSDIDWSVPYLHAGRSRFQFDMVYTKTKPATGWNTLSFDDRAWKAGRGPIGDIDGPSGTAPLGTYFSDVKGSTYNVWMRRPFHLSADISGRDVWLVCGHDDEGTIYIDGQEIISWGNEWNFAQVEKLNDKQKAMLTEGDHVMAVWAKNNAGGFFFDYGLYGTTGNEPMEELCAKVEVDYSKWEEYPLVKKFGVYQTPWTLRTWLMRDLPKMDELETRMFRYESAWGQGGAFGEPCISGTAGNLRFNYTNYDYVLRNAARHTESLLVTHGYCPSMLNGGDSRNKPSDMNAWTTINEKVAAHWGQLGFTNQYIEIWNEPDFNWFFNDTKEDYLEMYQLAAPAVKRTNPDAKVGGPVTAGTDWHSDFARFTKENKLPIDFFSIHSYASQEGMVSSAHNALSSYGSKETELIMSEFSPYAAGGPEFKTGGPVEQAEAAMTFFNALPHFLQCVDLTSVTWAQYIDAADVHAGTTLANGDKMGLIDGDSGARKALFYGFQLYGWMPLNRAALSSDTNLKGMASSDKNCVAAVVWNDGTNEKPLRLTLSGIPFREGTIEVYHIDKEHNSYFETKTRVLTADINGPVTITGGELQLCDTVRARGLYFVRIMADAAQKPFPKNELAKVIRTHQYYYNGRSADCPYAYFDAKTWTAALSLNQQARGWALVGVTAEEIPDVIHVSCESAGAMKMMDQNASLCLRIDYQTADGYTKAVVVHGGSYRTGRLRFQPWGTAKKPGEVVKVDDFSDFEFDFLAHTPEGFTGRAIISFDLASLGAGSKANIQLTPSSNPSALRATPLGPQARDPRFFNLQGIPVPDSYQGLVVHGGKVTLR